MGPNQSAPANIPLAQGGPPIIATRMMQLRADLARAAGYDVPGRLPWWRVLEHLLADHDDLARAAGYDVTGRLPWWRVLEHLLADHDAREES